jgi:NAD(P)-dependent dehydrogenase (short-subunit alcohol dehydrogenase family)
MNKKIAIVTGGANGIGRSVCLRLIDKGYGVIIADIDQNVGKRLEKEWTKEGHTALFIETDTGSESSIKRMAEQTEQAFGRLDVLVNGASSFVIKGIEAEESEWQASFQVNVIGYALCVKHCLPLLRKTGKGSIVNIGSISGYIAQPGFVTYSAAKGAINAMTRCLARDLASDGIRVNAIHPGSVWTETNERFHREFFKMTREDAEALDRQNKDHMLGRFADPEEIARVIVFMASEDASFVTGANWIADGGYTAW